MKNVIARTFVCLILLTFAPLAEAQKIKSDKPNIILIMADDLGYECISSYGSSSYQTPNIDNIAKTGLKFNHAYAQPLCTPSRVKIMTGLSNIRNYVEFGKLEKNQITFAHLLKNVGYKTAVVGKWQLQGGYTGPNHFGFDNYCLWQLARRKKTLQSRYANAGLEQDGKDINPKNQYGPDVVNQYALNFIRKNKDNPFLLYYPMILTHCPFEQTPDSPDYNAASKGSPTYKGKAKYFKDMVHYMDKLVGNLTKELEKHGIRENTIIIFTGDNGTDKPIVSNVGRTRVVGGKRKTNDTGTRVPFVISWPRFIKPNTVTDDIIDFSDILPTICDAANVSLPQSPGIDGVSFLPQLKGQTGTPRDYIYIWFSRNAVDKEAQSFTRNQRYKLYSTGKFYDLKKDPLEKTPLKTLTSTEQKTKSLLQQGLDKFKHQRRNAVKKPNKE